MLKQKGLTLSGFMTWAIIFAFAALLAFKLGPAYTEDLTIQKHFKTKYLNQVLLYQKL